MYLPAFLKDIYKNVHIITISSGDLNWSTKRAMWTGPFKSKCVVSNEKVVGGKEREREGVLFGEVFS